MGYMRATKFKYTSFLDDVIKDIEKKEAKNRLSAVKHATKIMRRNASSVGDSLPGDFPSMNTKKLRKSIGYKLRTERKYVSWVGSKSPFIHLTEFGWGDGRVTNKRPLVYRTLVEETPMIEKLLSESYF